MYLDNFNSNIQKLITDKIFIFDERPFNYELEDNPVKEKELLEAINKMDSLDKSFILIDLNEYWECDIFNRSGEDSFTKLHNFLLENINAKKVILMTEDCNFETLYNKWCEQKNIKYKMNVIGHPSLFQHRALEYKLTNIHEIIKYKDRPIHPNKNFMCLMGIYSRHRNSLQKFFNDNNLWDSNYISYIGNNEWKNPIVLQDSGIMENITQRNSTAKTDDLGYYFDSSYFSFIPESNKWTVAPNSLFLTEKTTKVLAHGHPFIMMCSVGALKQLRDYGFETFPELFDESYDEIEDMDKRDAFIKKEILRVGTMNQEELHKICESVEEKCIHNQKVLFSCEEIIKQFTDKIKRIYDV